MIPLNRILQGRILDIGGGGEGIIGRLYREQVIAIDCCQQELDDAPYGFEKIKMDATHLDFPPDSFDHVTFFFTMMFLSQQEQPQAVAQAVRVLKPSGNLHIWDCDIVSAYPEPFCIDLEIRLPDEHISTTYGIGKLGGQSQASITRICTDAGLKMTHSHTLSDGFYLCFQRI